MNSTNKLAICANNFADALCKSCLYRDEDDSSYVKCKKCEYCNLKEMRFLIEDILGGSK